jgi:hypothetical protein
MAIHLEKGQPLKEHNDLIVFLSGDYEENDLVLVANIKNPEEAICQYEAKYIAYGNEVYQ